MNKIYNKYKLTNSNEIFELIINLYLLECEYRNIFQIMREKNDKLIKKLVTIIKKTKYNYKIYNYEKNFRLIIYNQNKFNIDELDETWKKQFAKQCTSSIFINWKWLCINSYFTRKMDKF